MSFPNIPDITPEINITFEDAVNLLLTSIALEEMSLSKLMDAETCKILCVLNSCKQDECHACDCTHENCVLQNALRINKSVDASMQNMIKMQMLLQFKLEKVKEMIPSTSTTTATSTTTTTTCTKTTTTKCTTATTTCATSTCSTTTKRSCSCCLTGKGNGSIVNPCDEFAGQAAVLKAAVSCSNPKNNSIRYNVGTKEDCFEFYAPAHSIKIECSCKHPKNLVLYGRGRVERKSRCEPTAAEDASFQLTIFKAKGGRLTVHMALTTDTQPGVCHNSGMMQIKEYGSTLTLEICC